jgi:hypothetical protein
VARFDTVEVPRPLTVAALLAMVLLQLLFGVARLLAEQPWGGPWLLTLSLLAIAAAGLAQVVAFASWARTTRSTGWTVACLLLAAAGLVPPVAVARWWLAG